MTKEEIIDWFLTNPFNNPEHAPFNAAVDAIKKLDQIEAQTREWKANADKQNDLFAQGCAYAYGSILSLIEGDSTKSE